LECSDVFSSHGTVEITSESTRGSGGRSRCGRERNVGASCSGSGVVGSGTRSDDNRYWWRDYRGGSSQWSSTSSRVYGRGGSRSTVSCYICLRSSDSTIVGDSGSERKR
jgi:hypothetical protein